MHTGCAAPSSSIHHPHARIPTVRKCPRNQHEQAHAAQQLTTNSQYCLLTSFSRLSLHPASNRPAHALTTPSAARPTLAQANPAAAQQSTADHAAFSTTAPVFGPRDTYSMTHKKRKRKFGFLARLRSRTGRKILTRRRAKGRQNMSH
jgi:ribosomal protein L34